MRASVASSASRTSPVPSGDSSSTTMTVAPGTRVRTMSSSRPMFLASLYVGMTIATFSSAMAAPSLLEPHVAQVLVEEVAGQDFPALHGGRVRHDPIPPQRRDIVRLLVEHAPLELGDQLTACFAVGGPALALVELVENGILVAAVVLGA